MNIVRIEKTKLLEAIQTNRDNHRKIFLEAQDNYRKAFIKEVDKMLAEAKAGGRIQRAVKLIAPVDQTKEYDRVIKMLLMSDDKIIELTQQEFANFVMDQWNWTMSFYATNRG